jgi:Skp family chaperone for outer membrane proteins
MKWFFSGITFLFLLINTASASLSYFVVDIDKIINSSKSYNEFKTRWDQVNRKYQKEIEVYEKKIDFLDKELLSRHNIDEQELKNSRNLIGKYENKIRQLMQQRTIVLDKAMVDALNIVRMNIADIVGEYANLYKADLVLSTSQVVYYTSNLDLTQKILNKLNEKLSRINIEINSNVNAE